MPCPASEFEAGTCSETSLIGSAAAFTPLLPAPPTGPVFPVRTRRHRPRRVEFGAPVPLKLIGEVSLAEGIVNTFTGIPDLPLSRFELTVNGGPRGLLANAQDLCQPTANRHAGPDHEPPGATANVEADFTAVGCQPATPGSNAIASGGEGRPSAAIGLKYPAQRGTLTGRFRAGQGGSDLPRWPTPPRG